MSETIIKKKDLKIMERLKEFLLNVRMSPQQLDFLETEIKPKSSYCWNEAPPWNRNFIRGITAANARIHFLLDAIRGQMTEHCASGLTKVELQELAGIFGIEKSELGATKKLLWAQIKRRLSPNLSRAEVQAILYTVLKTLTDTEIAWLKEHRSVNWKKYRRNDQEWIKSDATTITNCSTKIEDILHAVMNQTDFKGYRGRVSRSHLLALEKRLGIFPPSAKFLPKGAVKSRMLKAIQEAKQESIIKDHL